MFVLGYPWGHLLTLLHHLLPSGDCAAWQKNLFNREQKTLTLVILHYVGGGDLFITKFMQINTKNICNIWWDLPTTHVIKQHAVSVW